MQKDVDYRKLKIRDSNSITYDFSDYKTFKELFRDFYYRNMSIDEPERRWDEFDGVLGALSTYPQRRKNILKQRIDSWIMQKIFTRGEKKLLKGLKMEYFH